MRRDPLKRRAYAWEEDFGHSAVKTMSLPEMREAVREACQTYNVAPPKVVKLKPAARISFWMPDANVIGFIECEMNQFVALHEAAHCICDRLYAHENLADHSHEWLGIYIWLIEKSGLLSRRALKATLKARGLSYRPEAP